MDTFKLKVQTGSYAGCVVAWSPIVQPDGSTRYTLNGYADPIIAAQLIESAASDQHGLVWLDTSDANSVAAPALENLIAVWGRDIEDAQVIKVTAPDPTPAADVAALQARIAELEAGGTRVAGTGASGAPTTPQTA